MEIFHLAISVFVDLECAYFVATIYLREMFLTSHARFTPDREYLPYIYFFTDSDLHCSIYNIM